MTTPAVYPRFVASQHPITCTPQAAKRQRLMNVAKAVLEAPPGFTMRKFFHSCGTPACALGNYTLRTDLQDAFKQISLPNYDGDLRVKHCISLKDQHQSLGYSDAPIMEHFGITKSEARELFGDWGCNCLDEKHAVAAYIEGFVRYKFSAWIAADRFLRRWTRGITA